MSECWAGVQKHDSCRETLFTSHVSIHESCLSVGQVCRPQHVADVMCKTYSVIYHVRCRDTTHL